MQVGKCKLCGQKWDASTRASLEDKFSRHSSKFHRLALREVRPGKGCVLQLLPDKRTKRRI